MQENYLETEPEIEQQLEDEIEYVSKSQMKREAHYLQELGEKLIGMSKSELKKIPLPDNLKEAIDLAVKIESKRGALKRQKQYIGKIMRAIDPEPIIDAIAKIEGEHEKENARFHRLEKLRENLASGDSEVLSSLINNNPGIDIQHLRQLVRKAQKEISSDKHGNGFRELFQFLKTIEHI
ncbi:MAG: DUF615 domain-containing protein [Gammaproteobacteria bacterium]|nr:MAG: DUF615 domain-containing protein [Gammaproteobacteria bacterium]